MLISSFCLFTWLGVVPAADPATHQATGVKVGEITPDSAMIWVRLTAQSRRKADGIVRRGRPARHLDPGMSVNQLEGECPGATGRVRVRYGLTQDLADAQATEWAAVGETTDYAHVFRLTGLKPATRYYYASETASPDDSTPHAPLRGSFATAPPADVPAKVMFTVVTGQMYKDVDHPDGYHIYEAMARLKPDFLILTGDTVYYDNEDPIANTVPIARYHWHRMYSYPRLINFHLQVPAYWEKDDHDTYYNDCWPTMVVEDMSPLTFKDGLRVFSEQVPAGKVPYRTFRWGRNLQVWLTEGRNFRSPNTDPDGPDKTIWGKEQKEWLKRTLLSSDAERRILISPTPIVGPDRPNKTDNHSNKAFAYEGNEFRRWAAEHLPHNFFIICGDRHWQYHSVDPATGVQEFSCGPASDEHAEGSPGLDPKYHRFHLVKGGFLSVAVEPTGKTSRLTFRFHGVHGKVVYEFSPESPATQPR
ncbi:MAG TPA: alkaline phosphatase D family protein [Phycisphaerae bacterium]|nr:alkaline phosphatase D family protein [Phycisphaerae bacterium]